MAYYTKKQLIEALKFQIPRNRDKICRALMIVYDNQTEQEVLKGKTIESNLVGFSSLDADILTKMAIFYQNRGFLSTKQLNIVRRLIPKYAGQVLASSIERGLIVQVSPRRYKILDKEAKA